MIRIRVLEDTIARRLAITVGLAAAVTFSLLQLFFMFGGQWAKPNIEQTGLLEQVATVVRMLDAAPAPDRPALADAARTNSLRFDWYARGTPIATALDNGHYREEEVAAGRSFLASSLGNIPTRFAVFQEDNPVSLTPGLPYDRSRYPNAYFLGLRLSDGSWILCIALDRLWGFYATQRIILQLATLAAWIVIVSLIASRQLSRPIERLAAAVRRFGEKPQDAGIIETGPRELREVARTINGMQAQIQRFIAYRTTMLAAISHDLRTPLTRIRLRGEMIDDPEQQKSLFRDVDEMQIMIDGALAFFRDDAAGENSMMFDLPGLLTTISYDYVDQGHDVRYEGPAKLAYVGRLFALKRVFSNLVENAIKYATPPLITLSQNAEGDCLVSIIDNGPGIPDAALSHVFEPYFRVDKSRNRASGGVGLGLTSSQAIIKSHGGDIEMRNRPEGGLEVRVFLPGQVCAGQTPPRGTARALP